MTDTSNDLIIKLPAVITAESFTNEQEFEKLYAKVKEAAESHVPDLTTKTGRDQIASIAYKVARTKTALIKEGKKLTEGWRESTKKVNAACNTIEERLDELKDKVRRPLTDWEAAEEKRVSDHQVALDHLIDLSKVGFGLPSTELRELLTETEAMVICEAAWEEFTSQASVAKQVAIDSLSHHLAVAEKQEAEAAELAKLRAEKEERDRIEEERLEAEEKERQRRDYAERLIDHINQCALGMIDGKPYPYPILFHELEEKIVIDDYVSDFVDKIENARQKALETLKAAKAADDERAKLEREKQAAIAAEEAASAAKREAAERVAAAERAAKEAEERSKREIEQEKARLAAEAAERDRQAAEAKAAEEEEQRRRDADKAHRKAVNNTVVAELVECSGITEEQAQKIVVHMVSGLVPNVTLKY